MLRAWRGFLIFLSRWFQIESLYKFNAKFSPEWVPRFLVFPGTTDAPRIGLAALEAEAFLVWPTIGLGRIVRKLGLGRLRQRIAGDAGTAAAAALARPSGCGHSPGCDARIPHAGAMALGRPVSLGPRQRYERRLAVMTERG